MFIKFSVAPLLNYTDKHCRYFYSLFTKYIRLYTGMVHVSSFLRRFNKKKLSYNNLYNKWTAIQFCGNNYIDFYNCSKISFNLGFNEINLNIGCPSINAKNGKFGYFLNDLSKIIDCLNYIKLGSPNIVLSVKHRINKLYSYEKILDFVGNISLYTSCNIFIIHARTILNKNFNTKKNLFTPIMYDIVYKLKKDLPHLNIIINGDIKDIISIDNHLKYVDGVMIGRGVYYNPLILFQIDDYFKNKKIILDSFLINNDKSFFSEKIISKIKNIFLNLYKYIKKNILIKKNFNPISVLRHVIYMFKKFRNSSFYRNRIIKSSYIFNSFKNYNDFEYFLFKNLLN